MIDTLFRNKWFPAPVQVITFIFFIILIYLGWGITTDDAAFAKILRNTNLANLIVWCFWWPAIIVTSVVFGRLWCTVCPMELIQSILNRIGLKRSLPSVVRRGWVITLLYAVVLVIGISMYKIHRIPQNMALYMASLLGLTVVVSLIFEKRGFCTGFCPVGHLLGLYALCAGAELRVKDHAVCKSCKEKPCINRKRDYAWYGRACQSYLFPGSLKNNRDCILCTQCSKACPYNNVTFRFRKLFRDVFGTISLSAPQALFFVIVFAFAFSEVVTEWARADIWLTMPYDRMTAFIGIPSPWNDGFKGLSMFVVTPVLFFGFLPLLHRVYKRNAALIPALTLYLAAFIPLVASVHVAKAIVKSVSRLENIPGAFIDPAGIDTAKKIISGAVTTGGEWQSSLNLGAQGISVIIIVLGGLVTTHLLIRKSRKIQDRYPIPYIFIAFLYTLCTAGSLMGKMLS